MTTGLRSHSIKKDGTKTINFTELEKSGLGSDINALAAPSLKAFVYAALSVFFAQNFN